MENLTGTWEGEYSINIGTDENPKVEFHAFRLKLIDKNGELSGTAHDLTLSDEPSTISGFRDNDIVSFIKKYNRLVFAEDGEYYGDDTIGSNFTRTNDIFSYLPRLRTSVMEKLI